LNLRSLHDTVRVGVNGAVTHGIRVPHRAANVVGDSRIVATPPRSGRSRRFAPSGIPAGVDQHLPCTERNCATCRSIDQNTGVIL
jgi:hypothetical protein